LRTLENNPAPSISDRARHNGIAHNGMETSASGILDASAESHKCRPNADFSGVFESEPYEQRIIIHMSASATGQRQAIQQLLQILGWLVAWGWALLTIIGALGLIITLGPGLRPTAGSLCSPG